MRDIILAWFKAFRAYHPRREAYNMAVKYFGQSNATPEQMIAGGYSSAKLDRFLQRPFIQA